MNESSTSKPNSLTPEEEAHDAQLSDWAEKLHKLPPGAPVSKATKPEAGRKFLEKVLGSKGAVDRAIGRPSLGSGGTSPSRTVRLPRELDTALVARAKAEHRKPSEIVRLALAAYLKKAS